MTPETHEPGLMRFRKLGAGAIDLFALTAALSSIGAMVGLSWGSSSGPMPMAWIRHGIWGAIFIYAAVFLMLHAVVLRLRVVDATSESKGKRKLVEPSLPSQRDDAEGSTETGGDYSQCH